MVKFKNIFALAILLGFLFSALPGFSSVRVRNYIRRNGTFVRSHWRTSPNHTRFDNWSTRGNVNLFTGKKGYRKPF